jgi:hypothetical protein
MDAIRIFWHGDKIAANIPFAKNFLSKNFLASAMPGNVRSALHLQGHMKNPAPLLATALMLAANAHAASEAMLNTSTLIVGYVVGTAGWTFQPQADISVTALGCFTNVLYVSSQPISVGLWASDGTLLASNSITSGSLLVDQTLYQSIAAVSLSLGQTYYIGAISSAGIIVGPALDGEHGSATMAPEIQLGLLAYETNAPVFAFPSLTQGLPGSAFLAPNFEFSVVPEPSILCLISVGASGVLLKRRRHAQAH